MSYFVIIRGPLGIGKSTIAERLAQLLGGEHVSIDKILEEGGLDKAGEGEECIPIKNFIKANEKTIPIVREKLEKGKIVIFDGNFYHKEQIEHIIRNLSAPHYTFTLKAPLDVCMGRDRKRKNVYGENAAKAVYDLVSRFDYGILIDTKDKTIDQVVKELLSYLPKPHS